MATSGTPNAGAIWTTYTPSKGSGYYSINYTAPNAEAFYHANPALGHNTLGTSTGLANGGFDADFPIYIFATDYQGGRRYCFNNRISFVAMHDGLTELESQYLYNSVNNLRIGLGGGYIDPK